MELKIIDGKYKTGCQTHVQSLKHIFNLHLWHSKSTLFNFNPSTPYLMFHFNTFVLPYTIVICMLDN